MADASERNPSASREFLRQFSGLLTDLASLSADRVYEKAELDLLKGQLVAESEKLLASFPFRDGCTFTGILLLRAKESTTGLLFHTGDSLLISCNVQTGEARQVTKNNFWLVGRSLHFFQVEDLTLNQHTRVLLATDGLDHISLSPGGSREESILKRFRTTSPDKIPDGLLNPNGPDPAQWDDTAVIALDPHSMPIFSAGFLFGGTSQFEEKAFQTKMERGLYRDHYTVWVDSEDRGNDYFSEL